MQVTKRRAVLASAGALAGLTVAAATLWRKPAAATGRLIDPDAGHAVARPLVAPEQDEPSVRLQGMSALVLTEPPRPLPDLQFLDAAGASHSLAEFAGNGVVLNLWATWCVPCVAELPALAALAARGQKSGIAVVPLSSDRGGAPVVQRFLASHDLANLPVWLDPKGEIGHALGARGIPTTLVIDRQGRERARLEGAADWASEATLARLRELVG
jgi:thiol-disulfide isomerase/thioredoxin